MSFLNPVFLFGLLAASIPLIIHLFTRRRPRETPFPSLEFLSEVNQSEIRRLRIKQWLLLLLRALAIAAIALAMARPAIKGALGLHSDAATSVVVLVDQSGSMGARAAGADGLMVEMHPKPCEAWCDADQALNPQELNELMGQLGGIAQAIGRTL